jgi:hypothetical protein
VGDREDRPVRHHDGALDHVAENELYTYYSLYTTGADDRQQRL